MDYMPLNLGPDKNHQGQYYINSPGPYDNWAIEYGYSDALSDPDSETQRLRGHRRPSHEKALAYAGSTPMTCASPASPSTRARRFST